MVARQRSQWQVGQRARVDPHHLIDFSARYDRPFHIDGIYSRAHPAIRLVRTQTLMEGAPYCDFRFRAPGAPPSEAAPEET